METKARYTLIGLFTLAVIAAGFAFVYWLHTIGGVGERTTYRVQFPEAVSGLRQGSAVLFNGMRVGEVTDLRLDPAVPRGLLVTIAVERATPVRADTQAGVDTQGLMGTPAVSLQGGDPASPPLQASAGTPPTLSADPAAGQDTMQTARTVLRRIDSILVDNAEPLKTTIANLKVFTDALARNSDKLDGIIEGVERMTGGGPAKTPAAIYDLTAPRDLPKPDPIPTTQLTVADPTAVVALDTQRVLIVSKSGETSSFPDAQWSDSLPRLIQARLVQSFENADYKRVSRPLDMPVADFRLLVDLRAFRILQENGGTAEVEIGAKLVDGEGKIIDTRIFRSTAEGSTTDVKQAAAALNESFQRIVRELVPWTLAAI